ncbi:MAG: homoserine O-acetyltransferase [archaeon]|jgi:homoserine O-acetyltransferase|nr:homoserine O-acetyltransferase [archaeon]
MGALSFDDLGDTIGLDSELPNLQTAEFSKDLRFRLSSGKRFGPIKVVYKTFGKLNSDKSNAVFVFPTLTATPQVASETINGKTVPGWWQGIVGKGKAVDTEKFFVICADHFGGCYGSTGPGSINPDNGQEFGPRFPSFFIRDMAKVAIEFLKHIGIRKLYAVMGASIGGLLALETIVLKKNIAKKAIVVGASHAVSAQYLALNYIARQAIMLDPNWNSGNYYNKPFPTSGLSIARQIGHISYLNPAILGEKFGRQSVDGKFRDFVSLDLQYQIESYLDHQGKKFCKRFDPNTYIYLSKAIDTFDLGKEFGSLENAFRGTKTRLHFIAVSSDELFPKKETKDLHEKLISFGLASNYAEINSSKGHDGFFLEDEKLSPIIRTALIS